jgi:hypothetical protein
MTGDHSKTEHFHVRATSRQAALIPAVQAEIDIADETNSVLPRKRWNAFAKALAAPPLIPVGLKRLFSHPSIVERR